MGNGIEYECSGFGIAAPNAEGKKFFGIVFSLGDDFGDAEPVIVSDKNLCDIFEFNFPFKNIASRGNAVFHGFGVVRFGIPAVQPANIIEFSPVFFNELFQRIR